MVFFGRDLPDEKNNEEQGEGFGAASEVREKMSTAFTENSRLERIAMRLNSGQIGWRRPVIRRGEQRGADWESNTVRRKEKKRGPVYSTYGLIQKVL